MIDLASLNMGADVVEIMAHLIRQPCPAPPSQILDDKRWYINPLEQLPARLEPSTTNSSIKKKQGPGIIVSDLS